MNFVEKMRYISWKMSYNQLGVCNYFKYSNNKQMIIAEESMEI